MRAQYPFGAVRSRCLQIPRRGHNPSKPNGRGADLGLARRPPCPIQNCCAAASPPVRTVIKPDKPSPSQCLNSRPAKADRYPRHLGAVGSRFGRPPESSGVVQWLLSLCF